MTLERINPPGLLHYPPMAHVVIAPMGRLAFIAGQAAVDKDYKMVGGNDLKAQTLYAFKNLCEALQAAGATPADVVSSTVYLVGLNEQKAAIFADAIAMALDGKPFPPHAITLIGVSSLGGSECLVEISAVAALAA